MKKYGFTLVELLATIAILGILVLIAVPNVIKYLDSSRQKAMITQENTILDAANLYISDYCSSSRIHEGMCPESYENNEDSKESYLCLSDLQNASSSYADDIKYKGKSCKGIIVFEDKDSKGKTYLYCGDDGNYDYITDKTLNPTKYPNCGIVLDKELSVYQITEGTLSTMVSILQRTRELLFSASNEKNTAEDRESIKKEIKDLLKEYEKKYNIEYANSKVLHKGNELSGEYITEDVSLSGLGLDKLTYSDFLKDIDVVDLAINKISDLRGIISVKQNAYEYNFSFQECSNKSCKLDVVNSLLGRIRELSYAAGYGEGNTTNDLKYLDNEVQEYFKLLDKFSKSLGDNSISKSAIFSKGTDVKTQSSALIVYNEASSYLKNGSGYNSQYSSSIWEDRISLLQTAKGGIEEVINISNRMDELLNQCSNPTNDESDKKNVGMELNALIQAIDEVRTSTSFYDKVILGDSSIYKSYMLYDLHDSNLETISCTNYNSNFSKYVENYIRNMNLNIISIDANISETGELVSFSKCKDNDCIVTVVTNILSYMLQNAKDAINATDQKREEYNIQYTTYFKALNNISELSGNSNYSTSNLKLDGTNLSTSSNATNAKTLLTNIITNLK